MAESDETRIMGINGWRSRMLRAHSTLRLVESPDPQDPFVAVNCGAITESLQDRALFGHEKGAFTGAAGRHRGYFEQAEGGTLFLDEVAELTPSTRVRLLRVLQNRELTLLGVETPLPTDVRVISASNMDLTREMEEGAFREDLFYRLVVYPIHVPPLRERRDDIPSVVAHFVSRARLADNTQSLTPIHEDPSAVLLSPQNGSKVIPTERKK